MKIETKNLILRNYKLTDLQDYSKLVRQKKVADRAGFDVVNDDSVALSKLKYYIEQPFHFAIVLKDTGKVVGEIGLNGLNLYTTSTYGLNYNDRVKEVEYSLSEDSWRKGIMTEAMSAVVKFGFENLQLDSIVGACFSPNKASEKVMIKVGLIPYKTDRNYVWREDNSVCKAILCKMTKEQYKHIGWYKDLQIKIEDANESGK